MINVQEINEDGENDSFDNEEYDIENKTTEEEEWERGEGDRSREHLGVSQPSKTKKKKSRRPIDSEDILEFIYSAPEHIAHDTYSFAISFGIAYPQQYYPNYRRPVSASSSSQSMSPRCYKDL
ncbi:hypothetical protein H5410_021901, partial [Solanum commersonii]